MMVRSFFGPFQRIAKNKENERQSERNWIAIFPVKGKKYMLQGWTKRWCYFSSYGGWGDTDWFIDRFNSPHARRTANWIHEIFIWYANNITGALTGGGKQFMFIFLGPIYKFHQNAAKMADIDQNWWSKFYDVFITVILLYVYGMMFHIFKSIKSAGITERTGGLAILKKDKDWKISNILLRYYLNHQISQWLLIFSKIL